MARLASWLALAGGALLALLVLVTIANVALFAIDFLLRHLDLRVPGLPGYEDLVRLLVGPAVLLFFPYCQLHGGHIVTDVATRGMAQATQTNIDRVWHALTAVVALFLAVALVVGMAETRADNLLSPILGWQVWPFYLPAAIAMFAWVVAAASMAWSPAKNAA